MHVSTPQTSGGKLDGAAGAFGAAAALAIVVNTILACAEDVFAPLTDFMTSLSGNHWVTHGVAIVILFVATGLTLRLGDARFDGMNLAIVLVTAALFAGGGLALWFAIF